MCPSTGQLLTPAIARHSAFSGCLTAAKLPKTHASAPDIPEQTREMISRALPCPQHQRGAEGACPTLTPVRPVSVPAITERMPRTVRETLPLAVHCHNILVPWQHTRCQARRSVPNVEADGRAHQR
eukprot:3307381-Rhodomonas_salina.2